MVKRISLVGGVVLLVAALGAGVAGAAGTLNKSSVPADTDVDFILNAPVEILVGYNEKVVLTVPDGFRVLSCGAINDYTCAQTAAANPSRTLVTWQKTSPGQEFVVPTQEFPFRMRTIGVAGKYKFEVEQFYSNGEVQRSNGPEGSPNPAPMLTVTGASTPAVTNTTTPPQDFSPPATFPSSFEPTPFTPVPFDDSSTAAPVVQDTTPTTVATETSDTPPPDLAVANTGGDDDGNGIKGVERVVLLGLVGLTVAVPSVSSLRQRRNAL